MKHSNVLHHVDELVQSHSILRHPFYVAWQRGALTHEQLAVYARVYYPHVAAFPSYIEAALKHAADPITQADLEANLADELAQPPHAELWLDFAEELGLDRCTVASDMPRRATAAMVDTFTRVTSADMHRALAILYAYESQQPEVSREKMDGLASHYGVRSPRALAYFHVHATMDILHRAHERDALTRCLEREECADDLVAAVREGLDAYWRLLDGICEEAGIPMTC